MTDKITPFTYINAINEGKWMKVGKEYNKFLTTRFFSYFVDTVLIANEINQTGDRLTAQQHFDFFYGLVGKKKRFATWFKSPEEENLKSICVYFDQSPTKARETITMLTEVEIKEIVEWIDERDKI